MNELQATPYFIPEIFTYGQQVVSTRTIRTDDGFVVPAGAVGQVTRVGTWLRRTYVYAVHFSERDRTVVCGGGDLALSPHPALFAYGA
jgi:hypothetical protein